MKVNSGVDNKKPYGLGILMSLLMLVAGASGAAAQNNTNFGNESLSSVTTGTGNSAFGDSALRLDPTGSNNSALGFGAMFNNASGNRNTAMGVGALDINNADDNSAFG